MIKDLESMEHFSRMYEIGAWTHIADNSSEFFQMQANFQVFIVCAPPPPAILMHAC